MDPGASRSIEAPLGRERVLVVDDKPANLTAAAAALETLGADVVCVESGHAALGFLVQHEVALVLLDVNMPSMDGFEVAQIIRGRNRSRRTPIIFVTAYDRDEQGVLAAYELGAVDFLFKPFAPAILRAKASVFIDLARQERVIREHERLEHATALELARKTWQEEALRQQRDHLAEIDRRKDRFLAMLGHELRNPLAPLAAGLEVLQSAVARDSEIDPVIQRTRAVMQRQVEHLTRLVDDLFDVSRINSGKVELRIATVCIQDVVAEAVATSRPLLEEARHELILDVAAERLFIQGELVRLVEVVANLLNNAARYTPPGGKICLRCLRVRDQIEVRVEDSGYGISPALLPRIFDAFVQNEEQLSAGLGLGLTIVHQLVTLHRGTVSAHSEGAGRGTEFVVRLPLDREATEASTEAPQTVPA